MLPLRPTARLFWSQCKRKAPGLAAPVRRESCLHTNARESSVIPVQPATLGYMQLTLISAPALQAGLLADLLDLRDLVPATESIAVIDNVN